MDPVIRFSTDDWRAFLDEVLDKGAPGSNGVVDLQFKDDGSVWFLSKSSETVLKFTAEEFQAFREGVELDEFAAVDSEQ